MSDAVLARRAAHVLRLVAGSAGPVGLSTVARESGIPKATCMRVLRALVDEQLLEFDEASRTYQVSFTLTALMADRTAAGGVVDRLRDELKRLTDVTHETSGIDLFVGSEVVVVLQQQGPRLISQSAKPVPRRLPPLRTSTGRAFLAWADEAVVERHLAALPSIERRRMRTELERSRSRGWAMAYEDLDPGAAAVAAPVRVDDATVCTVWIGGPTFRLTHDNIPDLAGHVVSSASRVTSIVRSDRLALERLAGPRAS